MKDLNKKSTPRKKVYIVISSMILLCILQISLNGFAESTLQSAHLNTFWIWRFLGRLHPMAVHFPVALLLFATLLEFFTLKNFNSNLRYSIKLLIGLGATAACFSAILGLLLAKEGGYEKELVSLHQWLGIATALLSCITWMVLNNLLIKNKVQFIRVYRLLLLICGIGIILVGHFGAAMSHGQDYLSSTLPWNKDYDASSKINFDLNAFKNDTAKLTKQQSIELNIQVRAILAHNCYKCHGAEKIKGDLRLDRRDMILKGRENGPVIVPGNLAASELFRRISLPSSDKDAMPSKGKKLADGDIAIIKFWIEKGAPWPDSAEKNIFRVAALAPRNPPLPPIINGLSNPIDRWTSQYFSKHKMLWPKLIDDKTFFKRVSLDIIGLLPMQEELENFTKDSRPNKRDLWIRKLLDQQDDYTTHWLSFWNDALRNDYTGTGYITGGRHNITDWLYKSLKSNKPYDQFVKELISPNDSSKGFIEGIQWRGVVNASQRTEMQAAQNVAQIFLGLNLKCTSCHNSFISDWKLTDAYAFANIFADSSLEINRCDKPTGKFTGTRMLWKELGNIDSAAPRKKRQAQLASIMVQASNGRFYRTLVNRLWAQLMGRGLIEPVDVMDNEPWNQDLLDWMAFHFQENKSNIKELLYLITTSATYQLPSVGYQEDNKLITQQYLFTGRLRKRMTAEQFADAAATTVGPLFSDSMLMYHPAYDKKNTSHPPTFARAALVSNNPFLIALGRPTRETVATSRESQANLLQALELTNGERFNSMIKKGAQIWKLKYVTSDRIIQEIYSRALGRAASLSEYQVAKKLLGAQPSNEAIEDLFWAILLLPEFQIIY